MSSDERSPAPDLPPASKPTVRRRNLLRHGALLAGVAGVATLAAPTRPAAAADGDNVVLGEENSASSTTSLGIDVPVGGADPTLALYNANGPTLRLQALAADLGGALELGQIANTELGPIIGVDSELGLATTFLATGIDLADLPTPYPLPMPMRLLDTRTSSGRGQVLRTSSGAWDPSFRVRAGAWLDIEVAPVTAEFETPGAWVNLTAVTPLANGHLSVYAPGPFPGTSTVNFTKGVTIANGAFVATDIVAGRSAIRIRTSATAHLVVVLTGVTIRGTAPTPAAVAGKPADQQASAKGSKTTRATLTRRLRSSLNERLRSSLSR